MNPSRYESTRPSQIGCADAPISARIIRPLSSSERGRNADRIPIGKAIRNHMTAPPRTSDAVTGTALPITCLTGVPVEIERPRSP